MSITSLKSYTFASKYARWLPEKNRRETWPEAVNRVKDMMLEYYSDKPDAHEDIEWAYDLMLKKRVLGSQRTLQFGGKPVLDKHARSYNCTFSYVDRLRFFQECLYCLLCGEGTGFSVQKHHIAKLPSFAKNRINNVELSNKTFVIPDSIEGWSDSIGILLSSYFESPIFPEYADCNVEFDYSKIRKKGAYLSSSSGKAPGPEPLKRSLEKIRGILNVGAPRGRLKPIEAYDIIMHLSDAVLSGGIRRSATICLFSIDDDEMYNAKIGNWAYTNPQRARSNNSVVLLRDSTTLEQFQNIIQSTRECGEPGYCWSNSLEEGRNPCGRGDTKILTPNGIVFLRDIKVGDTIWSEKGWTTVTAKFNNGIQKVNEYVTRAGSLFFTSSHKILSNGIKTKLEDAENIDTLIGKYHNDVIFDNQTILDGIVLGDGSVHEASNNLTYLNIGKDDHDYFDSEIKDYITKHRPGLADYAYEIKTNIKYSELPSTYLRKIPERYLKGDKNTVCSFLRGLYTANGSICGDRVTLKASSFDVIRNTQYMLSSIGIRSYYTINLPATVKFANGDYNCKQSYDLNITTDREKFAIIIGFIQKYKQEKLEKIIQKITPRINRPKTNYEIKEVKFHSEEEVYDITVDNDTHTYWADGFNVSNCVEATFYSYDSKGRSGWQKCNLSSINGKKVSNLEDFLEATKAAAIIGTCQAGLTSFPYLGEITEEIVKREALLGISITGMMENPDVLFNPDYQKEAAELARQINKEMAAKLGINPAARLTNIKPEGTTSCLLGTSSGIHPHHARRYFRLVQANTTEEIYKYFKKFNPLACEKSVWSNNNTDDVVTFCVEVERGLLKNQLSAIKMLEYVKLTQQNWVEFGTNVDLCTQPYLRHNVSNTIIVKEDEWDEVTKYIYENRYYFAGISLLPYSGDKDYKQAPFTTVHTPKEILEEYGDGCLFTGGIIETALDAFGDVWTASDCLNELIVVEDKKQEKWLDKAQKFGYKYFAGDFKKVGYCLKDVYNWKKWCDLKREYVEVDYTKLYETEDNTKMEDTVACAGGKCDI